MIARSAASLRDDDRPLNQHGGLGHYASFFARWLIERANREEFGDALAAAAAAVAGGPGDDLLAVDLRDFVAAHLDGVIDDEEFLRRLKKPRSGRQPRAKRAVARAEGDAISLHLAQSTLEAMLDDESRDRLLQQPRLAWEAFKRFAVLPVTAGEGEEVDADAEMLMFEWGSYTSASFEGAARVFLVDLVRQFSVLDADGDYDRMEQLRCSISIELSPELDNAGNGVIYKVHHATVGSPKSTPVRCSRQWARTQRRLRSR